MRTLPKYLFLLFIGLHFSLNVSAMACEVMGGNKLKTTSLKEYLELNPSRFLGSTKPARDLILNAVSKIYEKLDFQTRPSLFRSVDFYFINDTFIDQQLWKASNYETNSFRGDLLGLELQKDIESLNSRKNMPGFSIQAASAKLNSLIFLGLFLTKEQRKSVAETTFFLLGREDTHKKLRQKALRVSKILSLDNIAFLPEAADFLVKQR